MNDGVSLIAPQARPKVSHLRAEIPHRFQTAQTFFFFIVHAIYCLSFHFYDMDISCNLFFYCAVLGENREMRDSVRPSVLNLDPLKNWGYINVGRRRLLEWLRILKYFAFNRNVELANSEYAYSSKHGPQSAGLFPTFSSSQLPCQAKREEEEEEGGLAGGRLFGP